MKEKLKCMSKKSAYWLSIAIVGLVIGVSLQFVDAYTSPSGTTIAPNSNVTAPILTSGGQYVTGKLTVEELCLGTTEANRICKKVWPDGGTTADNRFTPGVWFNDILKIDAANNESQATWQPVQSQTYQVPYGIDMIRIRGASDDGGYCYAYWGTGHVETVRHATINGIYNIDNSQYPLYSYDYTTKYTDVGAALSDPEYGYYCSNGEAQVYKNSSGQTRCGINPVVTCPAGKFLVTLPDDGNGGGGDVCQTNCPRSFDNNGNVKICQNQWGAGDLTTIEKAVTIPAGANLILQGRSVAGNNSDYIKCYMDIQFAD